VLPATTFLEHKDLMGAYGHLFAQISQPAIAPLGEARSNVQLFAELGRRMGFTEAAFHDDEDALIAQALDTQHPWLAGITKQSVWKPKATSRWRCPPTHAARVCRSARRSGSAPRAVAAN
jgi:anaerobic selenocysteine-containing dehydrogenase